MVAKAEKLNSGELKFAALEKNLMDIVAEQQLKLGYRKESVRLYYPKSSLLNLLSYDSEKDDAATKTLIENKKLNEIISGYFNDKNINSPLSGLCISNKDDRFCLTIPPNGSEYVQGRLALGDTPEVKFLKDFLSCVSRHNISLDDIKTVFEKYSDHVICEKTDIPDFDYLIYFSDETPDSYMYCIKFEGEHAIYHRFTRQDYIDFDF
jgi:hypothetical protein